MGIGCYSGQPGVRPFLGHSVTLALGVGPPEPPTEAGEDLQGCPCPSSSKDPKE